MQYYIMLVVGACAALSVLAAHHKSLRPYLSRTCQGLRWRRAFPGANADEIRYFLNIFGIAFGFRKGHILKFSPEDSLLQIYNANNPLCGVDALEFESLAAALQGQYGFNLQNAWRPGLTLGELFALIRNTPNESFKTDGFAAAAQLQCYTSMKLFGTIWFYILALGIAAYAVFAYGFMPLGSLVHPDMKLNFLAHKAGIYTHVFASVVALSLSPFQFSSWLRSTRPRLHRFIGRTEPPRLSWRLFGLSHAAKVAA